MTVRQAAWFIAGYAAIVAVAIWFDLAVLCRGHAKFNGGCGGFGFYIPLWEVFLAPLPIAAILLERWRKTTPPPTTRLLSYLGGILLVTEVGFLFIKKFPVLLALETVAIVIAWVVRWKAIEQAKTPRRRDQPVRFSPRVPQSFTVTFHEPDRVEIHERFLDTQPAGEWHSPFPLLNHLTTLEAADWLRASLTTFGRTVSSILPGHFAAYARVYHPFDRGDGSHASSSAWRDMLALTGHDVSDPAMAEEFAMYGVPNAQARTGALRARLIEPLVEHLRTATATPDLCYFAIWEGYGGSPLPSTLKPKLELPQRAYHVFAGPLAAAPSAFSHDLLPEQSANLWWPADQAWCVATEIDFAWTYVGASRECIDAILADSRLETVETSALARW